MTAKDVQKKIQLVKGKFTPAEASHVIGSLIDEKINFHKCERLQKWISHHNCDTNPMNKRIDELIEEKKNLQAIIAEAKKAGLHLEIKGDIEITFIRPETNSLDLGNAAN